MSARAYADAYALLGWRQPGASMARIGITQTAARLRLAARESKDAGQTRRLLALATIYDGASRTEAVAVGGVTLQIVRDWVLKLNVRIPMKPPGYSNPHPRIVPI